MLTPMAGRTTTGVATPTGTDLTGTTGARRTRLGQVAASLALLLLMVGGFIGYGRLRAAAEPQPRGRSAEPPVLTAPENVEPAPPLEQPASTLPTLPTSEPSAAAAEPSSAAAPPRQPSVRQSSSVGARSGGSPSTGPTTSAQPAPATAEAPPPPPSKKKKDPFDALNSNPYR
jgi:hypothetical protein